jgi:antigen 43
MPAPKCFMNGSWIKASTGHVAVEQIQPGQEVVVLRDGVETLEPVVWVGQNTVSLDNHPRIEEAAPVRFRASAIADGQPARDLLVSPEHCMIIDGLCVPAKLLVNGGSIVSEYSIRRLTYYHLELERHGILLAENAMAESYLDTGNRSGFDNADGPRQLHPTFSVDYDHERWATDACAPLAKVPEDVAPIWARLAERSVKLGYIVAAPETIEDAGLHILADGVAIHPVADASNQLVFTVPTGTKSVKLVSRFCIPADKMIASQRDTRRLGVNVRWLSIDSADRSVVIPADHPSLQDGWNDAEKSSDAIWRWTDGNATIPWDNVEGPAVVTVHCTPVSDYPLYDDQDRLVA